MVTEALLLRCGGQGPWLAVQPPGEGGMLLSFCLVPPLASCGVVWHGCDNRAQLTAHHGATVTVR